jgi:hypothetical protein
LTSLEEKLELGKLDQGKSSLMEESLEYYLNTNPDEWTFDEKKEFLRYLIREIRVDKDKIIIYGL